VEAGIRPSRGWVHSFLGGSAERRQTDDAEQGDRRAHVGSCASAEACLLFIAFEGPVDAIAVD
jgi:hypothetical protein